MKILISNYAFDASAKTVTVSQFPTINLEQVRLITNVTDNIIIYNFADPTLTATLASGNVLTLSYNTTSMSDSDSLAIDFDDQTTGTTVSGSVTVSNFPAVQPVNDNGSTLSIDDGGGSITIDGSVGITGALPAGTNVIGHVIHDSGSTTAVTGNVTVIQGTATSLKTQAENYQGGTAVGSGNPLHVNLANTGANATAIKVDGSAVTQPISAASLPLPSTAATSTKQSDGTQKTQIVDGSGNVIASTSNALNVAITSGGGGGGTSSSFGSAFPSTGTAIGLTDGANMVALKGDTTNGAFVNVKTSVLPTGASTAAKQPALGTAGSASADVITVQGITSMTPLKVDGSGVTQPVSGTVAATQSGTWNVGTLSTITNVVHVDDNASTLSVDDGGGSLTVDGTVAVSGTLASNITQVGGVSVALGQASSTSSFPVTLSNEDVNDQTITGQGSQTALNNNILLASAGTAAIDTQQYRSIVVQVNVAAGTVTAGTITFEASNDNTNFFSILLNDLATNAPNPFIAQYNPAATTTRIFGGQIPYRYIRARISTGITGTTTGVQAFTVLSQVPFISPTNATIQLPSQLTGGGQLSVGGSVNAFQSGTWILDSITNPLPAGTNVIGHVIIDGGSTTTVSGNVTVVQPTGTNLHAVLDANSGVDIGKLTANQSVNNTQINGVTLATGTGVMGTGVQRVAIASDNDALTVKQATAANLNMTEASAASILAKLTAGATTMVKLEDAASADGDAGSPAMAIRKATPANTSGTDGDYEMLQMSAGRLWTSSTIDTALPAGSNVIGHVITDTGSTTAVTGTVTISGAVTEATLDAALVAQEATTSGVKGITAFGAVTTNAPTYTTAKSDALSLDTSGLLRISLKDTPANTNKILVTPDSVALPANQSVNINQWGGTGTTLGQKAMTSSVPVVLASDQASVPVAATLNAETTKAIGVVRTADGGGNLLTSNSTTYTAKFGLDGNLLGTLGTAFSTAGKVDVKGADGDVFVRQATAANLNATVAQSGTWTVQPGNTPNSTAWLTSQTPATSGGLTTFHLVSAATTNATNIKASAGQVYGWYIYNNNAAVRKVAFHNTAGTPTAGSAVVSSLVIPANSGANVSFDSGIAFATGIAITTVTGVTDADSTSVGLNDLIINIFYK